MNPEEIIKIFDKGIALNERYKASRDENPELRKQAESFRENKLIPCVRRSAKILSERADSQLAKKLLDVVVSHANSADETFSYSIGEVFAANPSAIEEAAKLFSSQERRLIYESVKVGWINVRPNLDLDSSQIQERETRLRELK